MLSRVKRGDVLPRDEEALAHAREEHPDLPAELADGRPDAGGDWTVRAEDGVRREMERMVDALEGLGGAAEASEGPREGELLDQLEGKVMALEREAGL